MHNSATHTKRLKQGPEGAKGQPTEGGGGGRLRGSRRWREQYSRRRGCR